MKNRGSILLLVLTVACLSFLVGIFLGRSYAGSPVNVSIAPTQTTAATTAVTEATAPTLVNINTAGVDALSQLPGIGEVIAQRIIDYREENGPFETVTELLNVEGIGETRLEEILSLITAGG